MSETSDIAHPLQDAESEQDIQTICFSDSAQRYLADLLDKKQPEVVHIRIFVTEPGTANAETCVSYCPEGNQEQDDMLMELDRFKAYIEARSWPFLSEAQIDYDENALGGQLTIRAPNARLPRLSSDSSLEEQVNYVLWNDVNPMLASHGGQVSLVEVTEEAIVVLRFSGGCQGCGMVDMTLKDGIETTLKDKLPAITAVRDITDHSNSENAWFKG
ncbi:MAG: Fe-S biogenesis protein NfuA [Gammaproteobacteria bacterium]